MTRATVLKTRAQLDLFQFMSENNEQEFNLNKALEEAAEFMEAAIKYKTKSTKNPKRPKREDVLEEFTDFTIRGFILVKSLFPEKSIEEVQAMMKAHNDKKVKALFGWLESEKYDKGL